MVDKQGTGDTLAEIEFESGAIIRYCDDGDPDRYIEPQVILPGGSPFHSMTAVRKELDDDGDMMDMFESPIGDSEGSASVETTETDYRTGPFSCDSCHKTWPSSKNQNKGSGEDICPDCDGGGGL